MARITKSAMINPNAPGRNTLANGHIPDQNFYQDMVDTFTTEQRLEDVEARVVTSENSITALNAALVGLVTTSALNAALATYATALSVSNLTTRVTQLEATVSAIDNDFATGTALTALTTIVTAHTAAIASLNTTKLSINAFNTFKQTEINPYIRVEHITFNPRINGDTFLIPFNTGEKITVKTLRAEGIITWNLYAMVGSSVQYSAAVVSTSPNPFNSPFAPHVSVPTVDGILFHAQTIQQLTDGALTIPAAVTLVVQYSNA